MVRMAMDVDGEAARMSSVKFSDGDVHGAIRILSSDNFYVPPDQTIFEQLIPKHPKSPSDRSHVPMAQGAPLL